MSGSALSIRSTWFIGATRVEERGGQESAALLSVQGRRVQQQVQVQGQGGDQIWSSGGHSERARTNPKALREDDSN